MQNGERKQAKSKRIQAKSAVAVQPMERARSPNRGRSALPAVFCIDFFRNTHQGRKADREETEKRKREKEKCADRRIALSPLPRKASARDR